MNQIVIVTRMAVKWGDNTPGARWLSRRLEIVERYVLPAFRIVVERDIPVLWVWQAVEERQADLRHFAADQDLSPYVVVQDRYDDVVRDWMMPDEVVSIRIDSDDVLHPDVVEELARTGLERGHLMDFRSGHQLRLPDMTVGKFYRQRPSISAIFAIGCHGLRPLDVYGYHAAGRRPWRKTHWTAGSSFLQIVGHGNVHNRWRDDELALDPATAAGVLAGYGIEAA